MTANIFRDGSVNLAGLVNPGAYVDIVPPNPLIAGVPSNIEGFVGVASWGQVGVQKFFSTPQQCALLYGQPQIRTYDMPTHIWAASQVGSQISFCGVRVTDGTDTAATATVQTTGGTATAKYTGTSGNSIALTFQAGTQAGSYDAVVQFPGANPERFRNILGGLATITATAGTGYTSVPSLSLPAPTVPVSKGGIQATAAASLSVVSATVVAGGTSGFLVNDLINLPNGVVLKVATVATGVVSTVTVQSAGSLVGVGATVPSNPVSMVSTSGVGVGTPTFTLTWGLGAATITEAGQGYASGALTVTMTGGGSGTGGSYTSNASYWGGLARVINNGSPQNSASNYILFTAGSSTSAPTTGVTVTLSGGTDGATGVGSAQMLGSDTLPRRGMFALRNANCDCFALCDVTDSTTWATQVSFAASEATLAVTATPMGDSIANAVATRASAGIDDFGMWIIEGDWPQFFDTANGLVRFVSPQAYALGLAGNLSPEQPVINKPLGGVVATQTSMQGLITADADEATAQTGGIDLIGRSAALGANYFTFLTGHNASSNQATSLIEYTRLTYFLAKSLNGAAARSIVGQLQSIQPNDPTRTKAKMIVDAFLAGLQNPATGSNGYGLIDSFATQCDLNNNPPNLQALGYLFLYAAVRYLNGVRYFVIKLQGGGNVSVTTQATPPSPAQFQ